MEAHNGRGFSPAAAIRSTTLTNRRGGSKNKREREKEEKTTNKRSGQLISTDLGRRTRRETASDVAAQVTGGRQTLN